MWKATATKQIHTIIGRQAIPTLFKIQTLLMIHSNIRHIIDMIMTIILDVFKCFDYLLRIFKGIFSLNKFSMLRLFKIKSFFCNKKKLGQS